MLATADPQTDLDDEIRGHRPGVDRRAAATTFRNWAAAALNNTGRRRHGNGDEFGARLAEARAEVYQAAAKMVEREPVDGIAALLMEQARRCAVVSESGWSLFAWDTNGTRYVQARAWQLCAWELDPDLPEVQRRWD